jgi:hypothetical protein
MWEWVTNTVDAVVDFFTGGRGGESPSSDPCDVGTCLDARAALQTARSDVARACLTVNILNAPLQISIAVISQPILTYIIAIILAILIFGVIGIVVVVGVIVLAILFTLVWSPVVAKAAEALAVTFQAEMSATLRVRSECSADCQGNLDPSECNVPGQGNVLPSAPLTNWLGLGRFLNRNP